MFQSASIVLQLIFSNCSLSQTGIPNDACQFLQHYKEIALELNAFVTYCFFALAYLWYAWIIVSK